jgi:hypothetical protein
MLSHGVDLGDCMLMLSHGIDSGDYVAAGKTS